MIPWGIIIFAALPPGPAAEVELGLQWHSESLSLENPGSDRFLPSYSTAALPIRLAIRPLNGLGPGWLRELVLEARWLRSLDQAVPAGPVVSHQALRGRVGTRVGLPGNAALHPIAFAAWSRTRFDEARDLLAPRSLRFGGGGRFEYERQVRLCLTLLLGYVGDLQGLGEGFDQGGLAAEAEFELTARAGPVRVGGRLGLETQQFGPEGQGGSWDRIGLGLVVGWEVEARGQASTLTD